VIRTECSGFRSHTRCEAGSLPASSIFDVGDRCDEPVSFARHRLHKTRLVGIVLQRLPDLANRCIDPVFGIYKNIIAPETLNDLLPRDQVAVLFQQQD